MHFSTPLHFIEETTHATKYRVTIMDITRYLAILRAHVTTRLIVS